MHPSWNVKSIGLEFYSQRHISNYGLLGIEILPTDKPDMLNSEVYYNDKDFAHFDDTLAFNKRSVFSALPKEYAETVSSKIQEFFEQNSNTPSGTLIVRVAAHCEVGSSIALFRIITDTLINILLLNKSCLCDDEVQELLEKLLISK